LQVGELEKNTLNIRLIDAVLAFGDSFGKTLTKPGLLSGEVISVFGGEAVTAMSCMSAFIGMLDTDGFGLELPRCIDGTGCRAGRPTKQSNSCVSSELCKHDHDDAVNSTFSVPWRRATE
jgi:hypothetical protein